MKKPQAIQISIPQPCSEDWQKMTPQDKGRYCDACKKCVVDFTGFTDRQLYDYFIQHANEKICGRFHNTQLNRPINIPPQPHSKLYRIAVALGLAIAVVTSAEQKSFAKAPLVEYHFIENYSTDDTTEATTDSTTIKGKVVDENGEPLVNAIVELLNNGMVIGGVVTDYDGNYVIKTNHITTKDTYDLSVYYVGKQKKTFGLVIKPYSVNTSNIKLEHNIDVGLTGELTIRAFEVPLIDPDNPSAGNKTITSDQIKKTAH